MISAYNKIDIQQLELLEAAKSLQQEGFISAEADLDELKSANELYHPGWIMRILLFIVGYLAIAGLVGLFMLALENMLRDFWEGFLITTGFIGLVLFETVLVRGLRHFKSGLTEVVLYNSVAIIASGFIILNDDSPVIVSFVVMLLAGICAIRYLDKVLAAVTLLAFASVLLFTGIKVGEIGVALLPFVICIAFTANYLLALRLEQNKNLVLWRELIFVMQAVSLIIAYAAANYFVVREASQELLGHYLERGENIPMAWLFYATTVALPFVFLYFGLKKRDRILIWIGLLAAGFSVFTFKYYFSLGHPEITITLAGVVLFAVAIWALNKLKKPVNGITRQKLGASQLDALTAEGMLISQTMGGVVTGKQDEELFGGGQFGGGGASSDFN